MGNVGQFNLSDRLLFFILDLLSVRFLSLSGILVLEHLSFYSLFLFITECVFLLSVLEGFLRVDAVKTAWGLLECTAKRIGGLVLVLKHCPWSNRLTVWADYIKGLSAWSSRQGLRGRMSFLLQLQILEVKGVLCAS